MQFQEEMEALLERHVLNGLIDAPWVRTDDPESDDGAELNAIAGVRDPGGNRECRVRRDGRAVALGPVHAGEGEGCAGATSTAAGLGHQLTRRARSPLPACGER
jgi:hypothetical protein